MSGMDSGFAYQVHFALSGGKRLFAFLWTSDAELVCQDCHVALFSRCSQRGVKILAHQADAPNPCKSLLSAQASSLASSTVRVVRVVSWLPPRTSIHVNCCAGCVPITMSLLDVAIGLFRIHLFYRMRRKVSGKTGFNLTYGPLGIPVERGDHRVNILAVRGFIWE